MKGDSTMSDCKHCSEEMDEDEEDEKKEQRRNIILLIYGVICLVVAFILNKVDPQFDDITWNLFSDSSFYTSLSFYSFILYTIGYLPLLFFTGKESIEEIKEGNLINENTLMIIATAGAYAINSFPEALFVILFSIIGEALEDFATSKSKKSIKNLVNTMPLYAHFLDADGNIVEKQPEDLKVGDKIEIKPGEKIPVDGKIVKGFSSVDLSSINGESLPKEVHEGESVYSGSINLNSVIVIEVGKEFKDSTLSKIMDLVENQQEKKAKAEKFITKFAKIYTPIVILAATLVFIIGFGLSGWSWAEGGKDYLYRALSILLISCPCSLVIAVPITFFAAIGSASKLGILIKGSVALEDMASSKNIMFDKTGTLTKGTFALVNVPSEENLRIAASLESKSTHPLGKVLVDSCHSELYEVDDFENIPGYGIKGVISGKTYVIGNLRLMEKYGVKMKDIDDTPYKVLYFGEAEGDFLEAFIVADQVKDEAKEVISHLKKEGYQKAVMLSGDDKKIASAVGKLLDLDQAEGELLPDQKLKVVEDASHSKGMVCYVGDGINDSPSILAANIGIAMGALGSDAAIEASDVVIMDDDLSKVAEARHLSRKTMNVAKTVIALSILLKVLFMALVLTGVLGKFAMIVSGLSDTGVMIVCVLVAISMMFYKPKYLKKGK